MSRDAPCPPSRLAGSIIDDVDKLVDTHRRVLRQSIEDWVQRQQNTGAVEAASCQKLDASGEIDASILPGSLAPVLPEEGGAVPRQVWTSPVETVGNKDPPQSKGPEPQAEKFMSSVVPEGDRKMHLESNTSMVTVEALQNMGTRERKQETTHLGNVLGLNAEMEAATLLEKIVKSTAYQAASIFLILSNALFIALQTEFMANLTEEMANKDPPQLAEEPLEIVWIGLTFNLLFAAELALHWMSDGFITFFMTEDRYWNILDVSVVFIGCIDLVLDMTYIASGGGPDRASMGSFSVLRLLRICRVIRVIRFIRVMRFFRELRMMIYSLIGSSKSLLWVGLVLGTMFLLFGISFTDATTSFAKTPHIRNDPDNEQLFRLFGTLSSSMMTLFKSMSGGDDWGAIYDETTKLPQPMSFLYLLYIILAIFAVVNIVTGVFVDSAMQINSRDKEVVVHEELQDKKDVLEDLKDLFIQLDTDQTGKLTAQEFHHYLSNEKVAAYFISLKLNVSEAKHLFNLVDFDQSGEVTIQEFVEGCYQLQGEATAIDTKIMQCEVKFLTESVAHLGDRINDLGQVLLELHKQDELRSIPTEDV